MWCEYISIKKEGTEGEGVGGEGRGREEREEGEVVRLDDRGWRKRCNLDSDQH